MQVILQKNATVALKMGFDDIAGFCEFKFMGPISLHAQGPILIVLPKTTRWALRSIINLTILFNNCNVF